MKVPMGPHQRTGRRRRRGKAAVLILLTLLLRVVSSWTIWDKPARELRRLPDRSTLAWMVARSWLSPADAREFAKQHPELSDLFLEASSGPAPWEAR